MGRPTEQEPRGMVSMGIGRTHGARYSSRRTAVATIAMVVAVFAWLALSTASFLAASDEAASDLASHPEVSTALTLLDLWIQKKVEYESLPSLTIGIVHDQELVWAKAYGFADLESGTPATLDTRYRAGSVTKVFTATAVMQLRDRGLLALDDAVTEHLPGFRVQVPFADAPPITIRHLLTHTSGLPREGPFPYWTSHLFPSRRELLDAVSGQALRSPPGDEYRYSNLGMAILGAVIEEVSGRPYADALHDRVLAPLGMHRSALGIDPGDDALATGYMRRYPDGSRRIHDDYPTGALASAAALVTTLRDLARFASLQFRDGPDEAESGTNEVLRAATLRQMHRVHFLYPNWRGGMGLGFRVAERDGKTVVSHGGWIGGHRSHLMFVPEEKIAVVALTNADDGSPYPYSFEAYDSVGPSLRAAASAAEESAAKESAAEESASRPATAPEAWDAYLGRYSDPWGSEYEVLVLGGRLAMVGFDDPPADHARDGLTWLEPLGDGTFRMPDGDPVIFEVGDDGSTFRVQRRYDFLFPLGADGLPEVTEEIPMPVTEDALPKGGPM